MKGFLERGVPKYSSRGSSATPSPNSTSPSVSSDSAPSESKPYKAASLWSSFFASAFAAFESHSESSPCEKKVIHTRSNGWTSAVKRVVTSGSMRRIQERVMGSSKTGISSTTSDIWLLGECYRISQDESSTGAASYDGIAAFKHDFSSRILMTYRKGFNSIGDTKYTSDAGWGCMLRSSQMLLAQALLLHQVGRSWRKSLEKPLDQEYIKILHLLGDSEVSAFSIHNLLEAGKDYGLAAGSWVGPYATCRSWESLARHRRGQTDSEHQTLPMAVYVVSGDEDGERGGAPVVCIEDASRRCFEFSNGQAAWTPILLLVPLVLGLEKINTRYIPSLRATFTFPQSLGILGGKPGASTYIVGVQDDNAFYLDPHDVQPTINISGDDLEADTSSYHSDLIRHIPLDLIDPSLAIGFYCRDKDDLDDFCHRASKLADESSGAPLFTVTHTHKLSKPVDHIDMSGDTEVQDDDSFGMVTMNDVGGLAHEDDWQLL
ncbi:cysteine protease ATG4-like isoform X1 [Tripterygium wilfordii]|uniref:Cysteine protease n=1 Tax=Tripterygium wilfordii TaxID=458696 RepID=A0A7J7D8W0_TRIWF|nr:cysteine protease ATG4-like [Tripterygium wilfordii]XP_038712111.1 cysteine protease ATG4-like [Tripterygium wilfordii]KAF5742805.1 cysteine protease ATG4-like isoform X1 [Tripterygium wilfordii]